MAGDERHCPPGSDPADHSASGLRGPRRSSIVGKEERNDDHHLTTPRRPGRCGALRPGRVLERHGEHGSVGRGLGGPPSVAASEAASVAPSAPAIVVPAAIAAAGKLVWCSDVSYAPEEFFMTDGTTAQGSDVDIAKDIAKRFGVTAEIDNTGFDGIIPALNAKKCDLIISGMNDTPARQAQVDFVDYLKVGPGPPRSRPATPRASRPSRTCPARRSPSSSGPRTRTPSMPRTSKLAGRRQAAKIEIQTFQQDTDAFQQLKLGRVDAYSTDSPVVAYYNALPENAGKFEVRRHADRPDLDRDRGPQVGHRAEGGRPGGHRCDVRRRNDEEDRRRMGHDQRGGPAQVSQTS